MDDILQTTEYELHKIQALNETLTSDVKKHNQNHIELILLIIN